MMTAADSMMAGVTTTPLARIAVAGGDVQHFIRTDSPGYAGFGEVYFSHAEQGAVKAWKRHRQMTLNLVVPLGMVRFVFWEEDADQFHEQVIGDENYARLTVAPGIWFGFQGVGVGTNLVANFADILHDSDEADKRDHEAIAFAW
jgi:dTDP-4-dehydrorhamnose 3,5-epimerase